MSAADNKKIIKDGLWNNNPVLVQVLGLCPLLAVSGSVVNSLALGLATAFVITTSNIAVSLIRNYTTDTVRLPVFVMIIASFTTCIEFLMNAFTYELYLVLGIFIPLIVTNCAVLGRADAFASKNGVAASALDGLMTGLGFTAVIVTLGALREVLGQATLFDNMHLLFGDIAQGWTIHLVDDYKGFLFAILPPGAFVIMGFLLALKNIIDSKLKARAAALMEKPATGSRRVRTTGNIS
ncbi:electron transport complex subunit RsxE [Gammaproteobacteria bacterium 42_54_T18]|nr:electron transport complex subunit RsxE [Gammaproteobacteria bacterium 42_54_T18]